MRAARLLAPALLVAATASPASAVVVWQGIATVTSASPACDGAASERRAIGVGTNLRTVMRPKGVADNGDDTRVSFVHDGQANFVIFLPGGAVNGTYVAFGANYNGMIIANKGGTYRRLTLTPRAPAETEAFMTATGAVQDFMFIEGCTVTFDAAYSLRQ